MTKLNIHLVTYNNEKYIPYLFDSLRRQTFQEWDLLIIDNASSDATVQSIHGEFSSMKTKCNLIANKENTGFAGGHNHAFKQAGAQYLLLLNPDIYLMPDVLEKMVLFLDTHPTAAAVSPRLMRWNFDSVVHTPLEIHTHERAENGFTNTIDALGLKLFKNRRVVEWQAGQSWTPTNAVQHIQNEAIEVFGLSGALPMYRKNVLQTILMKSDNLFDPTYHSYKEDVDLAYRLQNAGYHSYVLPNTIAFHDRTATGPMTLDDRAAMRNKKTQSHFIQLVSYKNHLKTIYKNEYWQNLLIDFIPILWYEGKKTSYLLLTNPHLLLNAWKDLLHDLHVTQEARQTLHPMKNKEWQRLRRWF